jgi:hypothetical protein
MLVFAYFGCLFLFLPVVLLSDWPVSFRLASLLLEDPSLILLIFGPIESVVDYIYFIIIFISTTCMQDLK